MRTMSIIGIIWFSICFVLMMLMGGSEKWVASAGWGMFGILYAIPYAIAVLTQSSKIKNLSRTHAEELIKLHELKEKGVITEEEFEDKKSQYL